MSEPIQSIAQNNYILQAPPASSYMNLSGLEYDGDKISGYAGSAFKAGDEFPQSATDAIEAVTANSGAWGGSALPISAGPGIKVNLVDNTLVFSNDETVLWSSSPTTFTTAFTASESISNFDKIKVSQIIYTDNEYLQENHEYETDSVLLTNKLNVGFTYIIDNGWKCWGAEKYHITNGTDFTMYKAGRNFIGPGTTANLGYNDTIQSANGWIYKVIGINRIAGGN